MNNEPIEPHNELPQQHSPLGFTGVLLLVVIAAVLFAFVIGRSDRSHRTRRSHSAQVNTPFPPIQALGWINSPALTAEDLKGKVLVIDAWAFWCGPCAAIVPSLIEIHNKYKDQGVVFIGLTAEGGGQSALKKTKDFVSQLHIPWANAYGAIPPLEALNVTAIPQLWVVGRDNNIVFHEIGWASQSPEEITEAIEEALKAPVSESK